MAIKGLVERLVRSREQGDPRSWLPRQPHLQVAYVTFLTTLSVGIIAPVAPQYAKELSFSPFQVGVLLSLFWIARLVSGLPAGLLATRVGSTRVAALGLVLLAISPLPVAIDFSLWPLYLCQIVAGIGGGIYMTSSVTVVIRTAPRSRLGNAIGSYQAIVLTGFAVGPFIGGMAAQFGSRYPLYLYSICGLLGLLLWQRMVSRTAAEGSERRAGRESAEHSGEDPASRRLRALRSLSSPLLLVAAYVVVVGAFASSGVRQTLIPLMLDDIVGATPGQIGMVLAVAALSQLAASLHTGYLLDRATTSQVLAAGSLLLSIGTLGLAFPLNTVSTLLSLTLLGLAAGYLGVTTSVVVGQSVKPDHQSIAVASQRTLLDFGKLISPIVIGLLISVHDYRFAVMISVAVALSVLLLTAYALIPRPNRATRVEAL